VTAYLDLADYLLIAEAVTGIDAAVLAKASRIELAESALNAPRAEFDGVEFYPEFVTKAAVLCARLAWNRGGAGRFVCREGALLGVPALAAIGERGSWFVSWLQRGRRCRSGR
jgi:hypothetical protein